MALRAGAKVGAVPLDLEGLPEDPADRALAFLDRCGIKPYRWQRRAIRKLVRKGRPRLAYVQIARKNGKTTLAAMLGLIELCLYSGRHIYAVSDSERNLHSVLWLELTTLINASDYLRNSLYIFQSKVENPANGSFIRMRPGTFAGSQGVNPHLVLADEVHLLRPEVWNGWMMATAAREQPMVLGITTPGYTLSGVAFELYTEAKEGNTDLFSIIHEPADPQCAVTDETAWEEGNPAIDEVPGLRASLEYDANHLPENEFRRYRLGQWTAVAEAWLPFGAFAACASNREIQKDEEVWLGFDGSWSGDSTALVASTRDAHLQVIGYWHRPAMAYADWRVDIGEVEDAIRLACARYKVREVACDPARWSRSIQALANEGLPMVEYPQSPARMIPATSKFYDAVLDQRLTWRKADDGKALEAHVGHAHVKESAAGVQVKKADKNSPHKIDLAVAAIMAHDRATRAKTRAPLTVEWF